LLGAIFSSGPALSIRLASMLFHQISELFIKFELTSMNFEHKWTFSVRANIVGITIERSCTKDFGFSNNRNIWKHHKMYVCWQEGMEVRGQYTVKGQMMLAKKTTLQHQSASWVPLALIQTFYCCNFQKLWEKRTLQRLPWNNVNRFSNVHSPAGIIFKEIFPTDWYHRRLNLLF